MGTKPKLYTTTSISRDYNIFSVIIMYKCHKYHSRKVSKSINRGNEKRKYKSDPMYIKKRKFQELKT